MNSLKNLMLCVCISALTGCMETASRLWNAGPYISEKKTKAYHACYDEREAALPDITRRLEDRDTRAEVAVEDYRKYIDYLNACMDRQGY